MRNNVVKEISRCLLIMFLVSGAMAVQAKTHFIHTDHLGTPVVMTDATQQVTWRAEYMPFGKAIIDAASTAELNLRFPGQYFDEETGLHHNYYRDYDPELGRYVQSDPIGLDGGINTYSYALANPVRFTDRFGLWVMRCARALALFDSSGSAMKPSGNPFRHDYLSVSGAILSFQAGESMFWGQGELDTKNERPMNRKCVMVCADVRFDQYVHAAAKSVGRPTYCVIPGMPGASNCQSWASDVLKLAKQQYLKNEECPDCFSNERKNIGMDFTGLP